MSYHIVTGWISFGIKNKEACHMDMDLTQLWYELKMELEFTSGTMYYTDDIVNIMNEMEKRIKGGPEYE